MKLVQKFAIGYVLVMAGLAWGVMAGKYQWFPYAIMKEINDFIEGYEDEDTTIWEKLTADSGGVPHRFIFKHPPVDKTGMTPLQIPGLRERRAQPLMRLSKDAPSGYRAIFGAFDFEDTIWGAILIDADGEVINSWRLSTDQLPGSTEPSHRKNMYGTTILPDGSIIFLMQEEGGGIVRVDYCGNTIWTLDGVFHHVIAPTDDGFFWTIEGQQTDFDHVLARVDISAGKVDKRIRMKDVRRANPNVSIFDLQRQFDAVDAVHGNDIEPLPKRLAGDFPQFAPGDLLISFKTVNLVFILDPETLRIKWWRIGPWDRQHDADWNAGGFISVFNNNLRSHKRKVNMYSNITVIDPRSYESKVLIDGADHELFSGVNGNQQVTGEGTTLVTSSSQGRIFEVAQDGRVVFDFINLYDAGAGKALHVSNALYLGKDFFDFEKPPHCKTP